MKRSWGLSGVITALMVLAMAHGAPTTLAADTAAFTPTLTTGSVLLPAATLIQTSVPFPTFTPTPAPRRSGTRTPLFSPTLPAGTFELLIPSATLTSAPTSVRSQGAPAQCIKQARAAYSAGKALDRQGKYAKAIEKMDEVIRLDPQCAVAYRSRGFAALHIGRNEEALRDYNEAIRLAPEAGDLYNSLYNRGGVYSDLGQYQLAIQDYNEAIRLYPGQAWLYDARARTYERIGDEQKAKADIDQACRLDVDGTWCRAAKRPTPAGPPGLKPLDPPNPLRTSSPTRGFFTNSSSGEFSDIDRLIDPTSLAVLGILLTLLATSISLFKGN